MPKSQGAYIRWFDTLSIQDVPIVGGKNASLGEMTTRLKAKGIDIPEGFATTSQAYFDFIDYNRLREKIASAKSGKAIRQMILKGKFPPTFEQEVKAAYQKLGKNAGVAVRSSATAEDLPGASFAGQQETFLHIRGAKKVLAACLKCYASLFTDRAIAYRAAKGFDSFKIALSVGIQKMVNADYGSSGVMFTLDPESGFRNVVVINASYGLGETIVQGMVIPDEFMVFKPTMSLIGKKKGEKKLKLVKGKYALATKREKEVFSLSDKEALQLAKWACRIEEHYGMPMDIEWAKDGKSRRLFILQARPETVQSQKKKEALSTFSLKSRGKVLLQGLAVGEAIAAGSVQVIKSVKEIKKFKAGSILATAMTSPDWVPIMKIASGILTDQGGRTSHAAIVSRELGVPAIVGCLDATKKLKSGQKITLSCAEGEKGFVYEGILPFETEEVKTDFLPKPPVPLLINISSPEEAFRWWKIPCQGVGLARMEFIIQNTIQIHPMALVHPEKVLDKTTKASIAKLTRGYKDKRLYFVDHLAEGIARIAASRYPDPVIVRMSDFKTNEYYNLIGGAFFEAKEENPMLGLRGASRYYSPAYREAFCLECQAIQKARQTLGLLNIIPMIPFCRTLEEADKVLRILAENGLSRGRDNLKIYVMAEIPSNILLAEGFCERFDGFSIGSNDLTQLTLGVDRDAAELASLFDERNDAVKKMIQSLIEKAHRSGRKVGICGQAPSDYPDFAAFLVSCGIDSISLNPDTIVKTLLKISRT